MDEYISVIVPVYNVPEKLLRRCIESIIEQTYDKLQIILVDDGSTDNSGKICDEYSDKDSRVITIHKENGGLSAARNTGYYSATSKWIMFVDGDDWIESNACEEMILKAEEHNVDVVLCCMYKDYGGKIEKYHYYIPMNKMFDKKECLWLQEQLLHYNGNIATAYCKLIKRSILKDNGIVHDERLRQGAEGLEFNLRLFEYINSAYFVNSYFYHYMYNDSSISVKHDELNHQYVINCFRKIKSIILKSNNKENLLKWYYNRMLYVIVTTAISGYFSPNNRETYKIKRKKYLNYLEQDIVREALKYNNTNDLSLSRLITLFFIRYHMFFCLHILAKIRYKQKHNKK